MNHKNSNHKESAAGKEEAAPDTKIGEASSKAPGKNEIKESLLVDKAEYDQLKADAAKGAESWDKMLRQQADFDNIRKRLERERLEFQKYAHEEIVVELLEILDDLERTVEAAEKGQENFDAFLKGIEMILAHLYELLKRKGVTPIQAKGKKFDPHEHEALMQSETSEHEDQEVIEELQKGYKINDRIVRTSKVRVAKKVDHNTKS